MRARDARSAGSRPVQPLLTAPNDPADYTIERWIVLILSLLFLLPLVARGGQAETDPPVVSLDGVSSATLLLKTSQPGSFVQAPLVRNDIAVEVRGIVARARFRQTFENASGHCVEAIYAFPLPEDAAIDAMTLTIGFRRIRGEIREREEAARVYEQAKSEGRKASLLEQHRPDLFTVSVASIAPGESVEVEIEYQTRVRYEDGRFSIRVPSVVAPRYTPGAPLEPAGPGLAFATPASHGLPATQYRLPGDRQNAFRLEVSLDAGLPLREIASATHPIESIRTGTETWRVLVGGPGATADRDFLLSWVPELGSEPRIASFVESWGGERWVLVMAVPPEPRASMGLMSREVIFILDTSGSMQGTSLHQAKDALLLALGRLRASDWFNVIEFNSSTTALWEESRAATPDAVDRARQFIESLEATGGTEMRQALERALGSALLPARPVRQVVFITDGQVGNEAELFDLIDRGLGDARLFTVGIGSAPNGSFMRHAARRGRGTATFIPGTEVALSMEGLFRRIESPVLSGVRLELGPGAEIWPERIPDLYAGDPLVVVARMPASAGDARVTASDASGSWNERIGLGLAREGEGLAKLWAREKIEALLDRRVAGEDVAAIRSAVVEVALAHHLVSPYTSLVAVDHTPAGVDPAGCVSTPIPLDLPAGWGGTSDLALLPQTGTGGRMLLLAGLALALLAIVIRRAG